MKYKMILVAVASLVCIWGQVWAQSKPISGVLAKTTPIFHSSSNVNSSVANPNSHSFNLALRKQLRQIQKDRKSGKLSETKAKAAWENLKLVRLKELQYFKQNGQKEITSDQKDELEQEITKTTN